jgi:outer membrane protein assembly factor BamB
MLQAGPAASLVDFGASRDLVFVGSRKTDQDNIFAAIKVEDGTGAWEYDDLASGQGIGIVNGGASVDYARGRVYFASHERASGANTVFALNLDDGALVWRRGLGDVSGSPIVRGSVLYVAADDGRIYALDAETGDDLAPAYPTADGVPKGFVFPDFASNRLFFATTGKLWCLQHREAALELVWSTSEIPSPSIPTVPSGSGYVWAGGGDGRLYQVDAVSGSPTALALADPATGIGSPSFDVLHRFLYVGSEDGAVYAVRAPF